MYEVHETVFMLRMGMVRRPYDILVLGGWVLRNRRVVGRMGYVKTTGMFFLGT